MNSVKKTYIKAITNIILYAIAFVLAAMFLPKILIFVSPFLIGALIAAIASPVVRFLEQKIKCEFKVK